MDVIEGRTFRNQTIRLDFSCWRKCDFINCTIVFEYGIYELTGCEFVNCRPVAKGNAETILRTIKLFFPQIPVGQQK